MEFKKEKTVRFYNDGGIQNSFSWEMNGNENPEKPLPVYKSSAPLLLAEKNSIGDRTNRRSKVFPEFQDHKKQSWRKGIIDPGSDIFVRWNRIFLCTCILALFVDPLFCYLPKEVNNSDDNTSCMDTDSKLGTILTCFRSFADAFYLLNIIFKLRTAFVPPSSRVFGRGDLVIDPKKIAIRYLKSHFLLDLFAALPLPQIMVCIILPAKRSSSSGSDFGNNALILVVLLQYVPRLYLIFPLSSQIIQAVGVVTKTAWGGAAYNLVLYMLASHVLGAAWYLSSIERQATCWLSQCRNETSPAQCFPGYLDCQSLKNIEQRTTWANSTVVFNNCNPQNNISFRFGIYANALNNNVLSSPFHEKYLYCLWWGLQSLSSYAQTLSTSTFIGETLFAIFIVVLGLVLFAHLIGNMQTYLQSLTTRVEEWRLKRRDTEQWMRHRQLPPHLQGRVRQFVQYKWHATRGVDEESILRGLPADLRRDIQRHLCLDLIRRVPFFSQMDDQLQDAICERLVSSLSTQGTFIVREGDPVTDMLFIIRGSLQSSTTNGGRTGFFDSTTLGPGDFCGEELLSWALLPNSTAYFPSSTRTVKALTKVEAFALGAEDLKFVANQFRRLHSKKLQHTFRLYSHQWRTWAACFIQAAWRQHKKRMMTKNLTFTESFSYLDSPADETEQEEELHTSNLRGATIMESLYSMNIRRGSFRDNDVNMPKLQKPEEPDFSAESR